MNNLLWTIGLILQILLLAVLMRGGLARKLPFFTALIAFYLARSVFLHVGSGLMEDEVFSLCTQALSLVDLLFQMLVAWELLRGGRRGPLATTQAAPVGKRALWFGAMIAVSAALAWGISEIPPINQFKQFDRGVILASTLMLLISAFPFFRKREQRAAAANRVLAGYALLAAASITAQIGKALAAFERDAHAYFGWSYVTAIAYLTVLGFWLIALPRVSTRPLLKWSGKASPSAASRS